MNILVIGGTGFVGSEVLRCLAQHELWVLHRGTTGVNLPDVHHVRGDRGDLPACRAALGKLRFDVVLDMTPRNGAEAQSVVEHLTSITERFVAVSSGSVYRSFGVLLGTEPDEVDNTPRREDAPLRRRLFPYRAAAPRAPEDPRRWLDEYDKIPAERVFLERAPVPGIIVRLPMVYGPGDPDARLSGYLRRMHDRRPAILLHDAAARWRNSRMFVANAGHAIACAVLRGQPGCVYNAAEPWDFEEADWIRILGREVGWIGRVETIPRAWSWQARPAIDELPVQANFEQHLRIDSGRIRSELGYDEIVGLDEALRRAIAGFQASPSPPVDYAHDNRLIAALQRGEQPAFIERGAP